MKVAVLIHVHKSPLLVQRLVSKLMHPDIDIFINVDAKADIETFRLVGDRVVFIEKRVDVVWGRFSQVQQMLNSFEEIIDTQINYSHILFISGQDYPIKNIDYILEQLFLNKGKSYLDYREFKNEPWFNLMRKRFEYWHFLPEKDIRNNLFVKKILTKLGFKRRYPLEPYYGSCWMCLSQEAVKYVLSFTQDNPSFVEFNKHTGCADELYFQSILANSPLKDSLINDIYRYIDWSAEANSPKILTMDDFLKIKQSDAWFARKVDSNTDSGLIDALDHLIS